MQRLIGSSQILWSRTAHIIYYINISFKPRRRTYRKPSRSWNSSPRQARRRCRTTICPQPHRRQTCRRVGRSSAGRRNPWPPPDRKRSIPARTWRLPSAWTTGARSPSRRRHRRPVRWPASLAVATWPLPGTGSPRRLPHRCCPPRTWLRVQPETGPATAPRWTVAGSWWWWWPTVDGNRTRWWS